MVESLKGKVAVVTGASKGIGAGIARALAGAGAAVVVNYASDKAGAERVVAAITEQDGKAFAVQGDVSKAADVKRLFAEAKRVFGRLDVLVNNAGVFRFEPFEAVTEAEYRRQFDINVLGPLLAVQEALKYFGPEGGSVINIGSTVTRKPVPESVVYTASKHAVDGLTQTLALDLGPRKIRVNSINPGAVDTEGARTLQIPESDFARELIAATPLGRLGQVDDIASVAVFLASPASGWLTGELLSVSGGLR
ncbi:glucose 1-dehydrogenase [Nannocystis sp. ILAH1]|uniref:SDR family NAD(P)-dependent oxidoreductase n=1 Tax=unclassified Nannocystis TaxID=2627009 RepID=UPI00226E1AD1|nr:MULTISPECIES: glucose 1-dehydrogenase [unclassified Nannocystis]MCY0987580.1 glucose 1-dehydrogenase [Nannocystis sp. ILAH1]MCY1070621.1 glucose 1-dehydrogenase [Nannocystis sp. RBIL2]